LEKGPRDLEKNEGRLVKNEERSVKIEERSVKIEERTEKNEVRSSKNEEISNEKPKNEPFETSWERRLQRLEELRKDSTKTEEKPHLKLKENTFDYLSDERIIRRENTFQEVPISRRDSFENPEIKREKSFENLVQEGFERVKRDSNLLKGLETPQVRPSPNKIHHNNSAPDIPKAQASPSSRPLPREAPYSLKPFKEGLEKEKTSYNIYKEIEERYKNKTSPLTTFISQEKNIEIRETPRFEKRDSTGSIKSSQEEVKKTETRIPPSNFYNRTPPSYKADSRPLNNQDSPMTRYVKKEFPGEKREVPSNFNYARNSPARPENKVKAESPNVRRFSERDSPGVTNGAYRREIPYSYNSPKVENRVSGESPGIRRETNSRVAFSPKVQKNVTSPTMRHADSAGKINRESPGYYRRNVEVRKETKPEPVRRNSRETYQVRPNHRSNSLERKQGRLGFY
jgi:hypothetical protein